jgi:hypothetical protein
VSKRFAGVQHNLMKLSGTLVVLTAITLAGCSAKNPPQIAGGPMVPPARSPDQGPQLSTDEIARQLFVAINQRRNADGLPMLSMSP